MSTTFSTVSAEGYPEEDIVVLRAFLVPENYDQLTKSKVIGDYTVGGD